MVLLYFSRTTFPSFTFLIQSRKDICVSLTHTHTLSHIFTCCNLTTTLFNIPLLAKFYESRKKAMTHATIVDFSFTNSPGCLMGSQF